MYKSKKTTRTIIKDININGKRATKAYDNNGKYDSFCKCAGTKDPCEWAKEYIEQTKKAQKDLQPTVLIDKHPTMLTEKDEQRT